MKTSRGVAASYSTIQPVVITISPQCNIFLKTSILLDNFEIVLKIAQCSDETKLITACKYLGTYIDTYIKKGSVNRFVFLKTYCLKNLFLDTYRQLQ